MSNVAYHTSAATEAPTSDRLRSDTLVDSVLILMGMTVVQRLVGFARGVLVCRWLSPEELGQWDMAFGFLVLAAPLAILGLPGSFGRYVEYFRQRGQLRTFLRRTTVATIVFSCFAAGLVALWPAGISRLVFGDTLHARMVLLMAGCLLLVIAYMFMTELFTALRLYRRSSVLQFCNSLLFATLSVVLLLGWRATAASMLVAYAGACLAATLLALYWLRDVWLDVPEPSQAAPHKAFWAKVIPFALWIWVSNWLTNLFEVVDRYMLLHFSNFSPIVAMEQVGHYHSARVVPVLLVSVSGLLASLLLPHLSHDWETGHREQVSRRVNLTLKLFGLLLVAGGALILLAAPFLFGVVFEGKFDGGHAVLPWTLAYCCWFALALLAETYLWCSERASLGSLAFGIALAANIGLNLLLVPRYGLQGAVIATAISNLLGLALVLWLAAMCGLRVSRGVGIVIALPLLLIWGLTALAVGLALVLAIVLLSDWLLCSDEKQRLLNLFIEYRERLRTRLQRGR